MLCGLAVRLPRASALECREGILVPLATTSRRLGVARPRGSGGIQHVLRSAPPVLHVGSLRCYHQADNGHANLARRKLPCSPCSVSSAFSCAWRASFWRAHARRSPPRPSSSATRAIPAKAILSKATPAGRPRDLQPPRPAAPSEPRLPHPRRRFPATA